MGIIISRFRKKKPTLDVLDDLDKRIRAMEAQRANAVQTYQRVSKNIVLYTVGLYVMSVALWYWYIPPLNVRDHLYRVPVLVFIPIFILIMRLTVKYYYTRKIRRNEEKLVDMRSKKKEILEEVMDHETYKVARTILERFAPENLNPSSLTGKNAYLSRVATSPQTPRIQDAQLSVNVNNDLRRRTVPALTGPKSDAASLPLTRASINSPEIRPAMPVAKPYLPYERTFLDRILEFIVGDGPSNRFALICKSCMYHNGLALKEEFEYLQFRCYNCHHWNPARKQRPHAPRLEDSPSHNSSVDGTGVKLESSTNNYEDSSSSDSEDGSVQGSSAIQTSQHKEDSNNETAKFEPERDGLESEGASLEHDSSVSKETGSDLNTSQEGEKEEETSTRNHTESNDSDKD